MKEEEEKKKGGINDPVVNDPYSSELTCPNCKQRVVPINDMCPECNHYVGEGKLVYQPLSYKTTKRVRLILTFVLLGVFILLVSLGVVQIRGCDFGNFFTSWRKVDILPNYIIGRFHLLF